MKTITILSTLLILTSSICNSQIAIDYPFKTYLDSANNLYVAGYEQRGNTKDIYTAKFPPAPNSNPIWFKYYENSFGDDRGLDLAVDKKGNTYVTGYIYNSTTNSNDIIVIKYDTGGVYKWNKIYFNVGDDKGMGIDVAMDEFGTANEIYISGYVTSLMTGKNFIIKKYDKLGDSLGQDIYTKYLEDDIATEIKLDANNAYVIGYSYQEKIYNNDIMILTYELNNFANPHELIYHKEHSNEMPTEFIITSKTRSPILQKSRSAVISTTDEIVNGNPILKYLTLQFNPDVNNQLSLDWNREFYREDSKRSVGTGICSDDSGNVYVTGYTSNANGNISTGLDFATMKYKYKGGGDGWAPAVQYYDNDSMRLDDKASSIKVNGNRDIYVAGTSDASENGFSYVKYSQPANSPFPVKLFRKVFVPNFIQNDYPITLTSKYAKIELAADGTPMMIVMGWNETTAYWAAVKYDANGNVEYTINNEGGTDGALLDNNNIADGKKIMLENYPNPFNPTTTINYELPVERIGNSFYSVKLSVYNILGTEIATLVNEKQNHGKHSVTFNASNLSSGIYFYELNINGITVDKKRMLLVK
jgi:hypothetical protein